MSSVKHASLYDRLSELGKAFTAVFKPRRGESRIAGLAGGPWNASRYGSRVWDKYTQVRNYKSWVYRCVEFITQGTRMPPDVVLISKKGSVEQQEQAVREWRKKGMVGEKPEHKRFLPKSLKVRQKAVIGPILPQEDYEFLSNTDHVVRLVNDPNPFMTGVRFWQQMGMYEELTGENFTWLVEDGAGRVVEMWNLPSQWVYPVNDGRSGNLIDYFEVRSQTGPIEKFEPDEIMWSRNDSPWHPLYATSRVQCASTSIDAYEMTEYSRYASLENGVGGGGVVTMPPDLNPPQELIDRLEARFLAKNAGPGNAGRPLILNGGLQWTPPASQMELAYLQSEDQLRRFIFAMFGLDESMMGFANYSTYASAIITDAALYKSVFGPRLEDRAALITERLLPRFGQNLRAVYIPSASYEDPDAKLKAWDLACQYGAVTLNEVRTEILHIDPLDDPEADKLLKVPDPFGDTGGWDEEENDGKTPGFSVGEQQMNKGLNGHGNGLSADLAGVAGLSREDFRDRVLGSLENL